MTFYRLVNDRIGFVACFNPKCACTTLKDWFVHSMGADYARKEKLIGSQTIGCDQIDSYKDYLKVLFIRDPFRRLVSFYCHWVVRDDKKWCFADDGRAYPLHGQTFSDFLRTMERIAARGIRFQHHLIPQVRGVRHIEFDRVIAIEDLDAQLSALNAKFGFDYAVPKRNPTRYDNAIARHVYDCEPNELRKNGIPSYRYFYNERLVKAATEIYRADVEYYRAFHDRHMLFPASADCTSPLSVCP